MKELILLAIRSVSCMFMMPLCGVTCFGFLLNLYHYAFTDSTFLYTSGVGTEVLVILVTGFGFYYALTESLKIRKQLLAARSTRDLRSSDDENDSKR